jgi:hypothetical protein
MTRDERITKLRKSRWIRYPRAEQILAHLDELLKHPKTHRMPNLLVFGETNNGKTALIQRFVQQHLPKLGDDRALSRIPVVVIQAPPVPEERRFYQAILFSVKLRSGRGSDAPLIWFILDYPCRSPVKEENCFGGLTDLGSRPHRPRTAWRTVSSRADVTPTLTVRGQKRGYRPSGRPGGCSGGRSARSSSARGA